MSAKARGAKRMRIRSGSITVVRSAGIAEFGSVASTGCASIAS
jgi:hypothetical protein